VLDRFPTFIARGADTLGGMERTDDDPPKVTPFLLRDADTLCPRRLACELSRAPATSDPVNRARVRGALLDRIRTWHATSGGWPEPPPLTPEERAVVTRACDWYAALFPRHGVDVGLPVEDPTLLPRRRVVLGGWVDLGIRHRGGARELRQLTWRGEPAPREPLEVPAVRLALLRLASTGWWDDGPLLVSCVDLLAGSITQATVEAPDGLVPHGAWLDERLAVLRRRADADVTEPGAGCGACRFVPRCPAHSVRASMQTRRDSLMSGIVALSPSSVESWHRCPREWRDRSLLGVPPSNVEFGATHGLLVHRLLHLVHRTGSCQDRDHVADVLATHGADPRTVDEVERHVHRCPIGADPVGHEIDWARAYPAPPLFVATARLDAVWAHDGILDVRDYKTGRVAPYPVHEDRGARLQAWVAAPHAAARGLRLRLRYEHLATEVLDDPDPWEPSDDDLAAIEAELAAVVTAMRAERDFHGVADDVVCGYCSYRAVCDESAAPGAPTWPEPPGVEAARAAR